MLSRLFDRWAGKTQEREIAAFVSNLKAADSDDIGLIVACASDWRHRYEEQGIRLLAPSLCLMTDPHIAFRLVKQIQDLQKKGLPHLAVGLMVWVHSLRAMSRPELRGLGRSMWRELQRGFAYADDAAIRAISFIGYRFQVAGCEQFPEGLTPDPR